LLSSASRSDRYASAGPTDVRDIEDVPASDVEGSASTTTAATVPATTAPPTTEAPSTTTTEAEPVPADEAPSTTAVAKRASTPAPSTTAAPASPPTTAAPTTTTTTPPARTTSEGYAYDDPRSTQVWYDLAQCESGGRWDIDSGNGYYGGLQFSLGTWESVGGSGYPHEHPAATQIEMGRRLQARQGWGAWPHCSEELGLR